MSTVTIEKWGEGDLPLLELSNEPAMMQYLGGPETHEKLLVRQERYLDGWRTGTSFMFRIEADGEPVGGIGYWPTDWEGELMYETGWSVHTAHQGRGYATSALLLVIEHAARYGHTDTLHAMPRADNAASNAVCRKAGFTLLGEVDDEYPPGNPIRSNDWSFDLRARRAG